MKTFDDLFGKIISLPNLYKGFLDAKKSRNGSEECILFEQNLHENLWNLHIELLMGRYYPLECSVFFVEDYKRRKITAPRFRDHVLHHAIFNYLEQVYDSCFISDSFACRKNKGTHRAFRRLKSMINKSRSSDYFMKSDITKYFYSVDHHKLIDILRGKIKDEKLAILLEKFINFHFEEQTAGWIENKEYKIQRKGMPIGSLLSQLFANIYLNELDYYVKHELRVKKYARYVDDFVIIDKDKNRLHQLYCLISDFLEKSLFLKLEQRKTQINKIAFGVDFLGFVAFKHYVRVRSRNYKRFCKRAKRKISLFKRGIISYKSLDSSFTSYLGHLSYTNSHRIIDNVNRLHFMAKRAKLSLISININQNVRNLQH